MNHQLRPIQTALFALALISCTGRTAVFHSFAYEPGGSQACETDGRHVYANPILPGFYPDPSVCRRDSDFYLVCSSFAYYPGIPIFRSRNLADWQQIGHVLDTPDKLNLDGIRLSGGIYAPTIRYNPSNGMFYVITTLVDGGGNFFVKTDDPAKGWSDPIWLPDVGGIDPSFFFADNGDAYIVHNDAPQGTPRYDGHRAIRMHRFDVERDCTVGDSWVIVDGGTDLRPEPIWIEGPHIYQIGDRFYLLAAEGGTGSDHSEVAFVSTAAEGPYVQCGVNPILTQRDLSPYRSSKVTCTGHADMVRDTDGSFWAVFLGCRPYVDNLYNTGRETFLLPVSFVADGTPVILPQGEPVPMVVAKRNAEARPQARWEARFDTTALSDRFVTIRTPRTRWHSLHDGALRLEPRPVSVADVDNPSFVGVRQQQACFTAEASVEFEPDTDDDFAGLVCFQNEAAYLAFGITVVNGRESVVVEKNDGGRRSIEGLMAIDDRAKGRPLTLRIAGGGAAYSFVLQTPDGPRTVATTDATHLSTDRAGGFVGTVIGMYASSKHKARQ